MIGPEIDPRRARPLPFVLALFILLLLAALSALTAFMGIGLWASVAQFGIAAVQTSILFILFMRLKRGPPLKWVFAISGFVWLMFLYGLSMTDYANRRGWPPVYVPSAGAFQSHENGSP
ncbi:MAG TPA: hypothetical protein VKW08_07025 [Xanthobacteraceae bacterium]|jgi:caa(3)-type oxidase subunit IV|nr:hypothetical protein [Xanthobacteraceae bacterium]